MIELHTYHIYRGEETTVVCNSLTEAYARAVLHLEGDEGQRAQFRYTLTASPRSWLPRWWHVDPAEEQAPYQYGNGVGGQLGIVRWLNVRDGSISTTRLPALPVDRQPLLWQCGCEEGEIEEYPPHGVEAYDGAGQVRTIWTPCPACSGRRAAA